MTYAFGYTTLADLAVNTITVLANNAAEFAKNDKPLEALTAAYVPGNCNNPDSVTIDYADTTPEDVTPAPTEPPTEAPTEAPTETPTEPPVTEPEEMTMEPKTTLSVIAEGKTDYTLVASADLQEKNAEDISYMTRVMDAKFGTHPTVAETASGKVISLAYTDGESLNWSLTVDEDSGNIEIQAGGKVAMSRAIQTFITQLAGDGCACYVPTIRGEANKGYSASIFCNSIGSEGGQVLVEYTLAKLNELKAKDEM